MSIRAVKIKKTFRNFDALNDVSITVEPGEFLALLGPSGSGKTTLLRIIAGLEIADSGDVFLEGENIHIKSVRERNIGFVFQHYALFRHMTVYENVAFGLKIRPKNQRLPFEEIDKKVNELLTLVHLEGIGHHYPSQLSGGQRQRIALARVLAIEPRVMLLDEPFGALDSKVRKELRHWMRRLHDEMHITTVFVTHDQEEAMEVADRIAILNKGKIEQIGTPEEIWNHPANAFVYDFLGNYNGFIAFKDINENIVISEEFYFPMKKEVPKEVKQSKSLFSKIKNYFIPKPSVQTEEIENEKPSQIPSSKYIKLFVRPFELTLQKTKISEGLSVQATVTHLNMASSLIKVELERPNGHILQAEITKETLEELGIAKGDTVWAYPKKYRMF